MPPRSRHDGLFAWACSAAIRCRCPIFLVTLVALTGVGCQRVGNVSGKITLKDKPVVFGTVLIQGSDGNAQQGNIAPDGSYSVQGLAVGKASVAINSPEPRSVTLIPNKNPAYKQEPYPDVPGWFAIPKQYEDISTSGLTYEIKGGNNTIDIKLE